MRTRLNQGVQAYVDRINSSGGIDGGQILLEIVDDGYEPFKTLKNRQKFIKDNNVFALFNYVGTPTASVVFPLIKNKPLPFLTPLTGAEFLHKPVTKNIFNLRVSYYQKVEAQFDFLVKEEKITKIGLLIQADEFGHTVEEGYINYFNEYGKEPLVINRYHRNNQDIDLALSVLKKNNVEAIAFVGTYAPFCQNSKIHAFLPQFLIF